MIKLSEHPEKAIAHECGHAIAFLIQGHGVSEVRVDYDRVGEFGKVVPDFTNTEADWGCLIAIVSGPMAAGDPPPSWPLDADSEGDEHAAAALCQHLGLSEGDYNSVCAIAEAYLNWHEAKGASALLAQALSRVPVITGAQLKELLAPRLARLRGEEA